MASVATLCSLLLMLAITLSYCPQTTEAGIAPHHALLGSRKPGPPSPGLAGVGKFDPRLLHRARRFFGRHHRKTKVIIMQQPPLMAPAPPAPIIVIKKHKHHHRKGFKIIVIKKHKKHHHYHHHKGFNFNVHMG